MSAESLPNSMERASSDAADAAAIKRMRRLSIIVESRRADGPDAISGLGRPASGVLTR